MYMTYVQNITSRNVAKKPKTMIPITTALVSLSSDMKYHWPHVDKYFIKKFPVWRAPLTPWERLTGINL